MSFALPVVIESLPPVLTSMELGAEAVPPGTRLPELTTSTSRASLSAET